MYYTNNQGSMYNSQKSSYVSNVSYSYGDSSYSSGNNVRIKYGNSKGCGKGCYICTNCKGL